ncbi:hypothetical protein V6615_05530 [Oscillospiraceae bacterium PP1C4]
MPAYGMFVYPWDIPDNTDAFVEKYRTLGCNTIVVNGSYHHCSVPDLRLEKIYSRRQAGTAFAVNPANYGRLLPKTQEDRTAMYQSLRESCTRAGISLKCWAVNLHNSTIGEMHPDVCIQNVWDDIYENALCVNHPEVREYAGALLCDIIRAVSPESMVLESISWMPAFHGRHHEFSLAHITPAIRYLFSLCFCPACVKAAEKQGIDARAVKVLAKRLLKQLLRQETTFIENEQTQLASLWLEYPQLYAYQQFRMESVRSLVEQTSKTVHQMGVHYEYIPLSTPFEVNSTSFEGVSYRQTAPLVDAFVPLVYGEHETFRTCKANIGLFAPDARVGMAMSLGRGRYTGEADFTGRVLDATDAGAASIYCYNYGMATEEVLEWVQKAGMVLQARECD